jgi:hypothetical protein
MEKCGIHPGSPVALEWRTTLCDLGGATQGEHSEQTVDDFVEREVKLGRDYSLSLTSTRTF